MPKIAQVTLPGVSTQVTQGPRARDLPAGAFGTAQLGAALGPVAQAVEDFGTRTAKTAAEEALVQFERDKNDVFFNPESGYFNLQGRDAYDNAGKTRQSLDELKEKYVGTLDTEEAKRMFNAIADRHITAADADIMKHSSKGYQAWEVGTAKASIENTIENASLYWNQPDRLAVQNQLGRQQIMDVAKMEGISAEETNERLQTYDSSFVTSSVEAALQKGSTFAEEIMDNHGDKLEGPQKVKVEKAIAAKKKAEHTQRVSQESVMIANRLVSDHGDDRQTILQEVEKIKDPEVQQKARKEAMYQVKQLDNAKAQLQVETFSEADQYVRTQGSVESYQAAFPEKWELMTPSQRKSLEKGTPLKQDWNLWYDVSQMSDKELMALNRDQVASIATKFDKSHRDKFMSLLRDINEGQDSSARTDHQVGRTRTAQAKSMVEQVLGKNSNKWSIEDKSRADQFYDLLDTEVNSQEEQLGRKLTSEEFTNLVNNFTRKVTIERQYLWDREVNLVDIPKEDLENLTNYLRANNVKITAETLIRAYEQAR